MGLSAAAKNCLNCKKSKSKSEKTEHTNRMFDYLLAFSHTITEQLGMEIIDEDSYRSSWFFLKQLEIKCSECDGKAGLVYEKIIKEYIEPLKIDVAIMTKKIEKQKRIYRKNKKSQREGGKVIFVDFA